MRDLRHHTFWFGHDGSTRLRYSVLTILWQQQESLILKIYRLALGE